jgi:XisH protein
MPANDLYHDAVCTALIKDGWEITDDPLILKIGRRSIFVDLGAEKLIAAEHDLEIAWGQFFMYARVLQKREPARRLYLAVRRDTFETLFQEEIGQLLLAEPGFRIIIFDSNTEEIIQWLPAIHP